MPPSAHLGLGAVPFAGGVAFRAWAPFAAAVAVVGEFNGWDDDANPMAAEPGGHWSTDVPGARVGQRYRLAVTTAQGQLVRRIDPRVRAVTSSIGDGIVCAPDDFDWGQDDYRTPAWNHVVLYELHVGTFNDSPGGGVGTLRSAAERLGHLRDLGVNAVELMPVTEFGGISSKGYNPALPFAVESDYGGRTALKEFVREAHRHGIAVLLDVVFNHFGAADLEHSLWRFDGWHEGEGGGVYFYNDWRMHTPWQSPRPDYGRPEVCRFVVDNVLMWLEEFRVDGLRIDQTAQTWAASGQFLPEGWRLLQDLNQAVDRHQPWKTMIAEDFAGGAAVTRPVGSGGLGFDVQWDPFVHDLRAALVTPWDRDRDVGRVAAALTRSYDGAFPRVVYTESHDENGNGGRRLPEEISPGAAADVFAKKRSTLGAALVLTAPGLPLLFQGQEFLEDTWWSDDRTLDWTKLARFHGITQLYRDLVHLRRNWYDTTRGLTGQGINVHHVDHAGKLLAFHRWSMGGPRDDVVVVANLGCVDHSAYRIGLPRAGRWRVRLNSDWSGYDPSFSSRPGYDPVTDPIAWDGLAFSADVGVAGYSVLVLSQD
ncbi:alpha-amylase family glycosyl hydrolase [Modestobacter lapidis]|nr:DUF3459 domain-containing protein [Modestobacter lapidis]